MLSAERKDALTILTMAIWQSKIDEICAEEPNANRRITRLHAKAMQRLAWWHCQSDVILGKVVTFLPPPF
jgi:maltooligosyltrehalose synthase